jgi:hypothetical protein
MSTHLVRALTLVSLLMQATFGAVGPTAVLCIRLDHADSEPAHGESAPDARLKSCCPGASFEGEKKPASRIALTPPCREECNLCVDVVLPDEIMAGTTRLSASPDFEPTTNSAATAATLEPPQPANSNDSFSTATGPPDLYGCTHRCIVRTTRLLI